MKWIKLWDRSKRDLLAEILRVKDNQDFFLGIKEQRMPEPKGILADAQKILNYTRTEDYQVWAQEAWSKVVMACDNLMKQEISSTEADFQRGYLAAAVDLLRISSKAKTIKESVKNYKEL